MWPQMVWPMVIVTVTNFEGFTRQQFLKKKLDFAQKLCSLGACMKTESDVAILVYCVVYY